MMQSSYGGGGGGGTNFQNDADDDDLFAPNPFRGDMGGMNPNNPVGTNYNGNNINNNNNNNNTTMNQGLYAPQQQPQSFGMYGPPNPSNPYSYPPPPQQQQQQQQASIPDPGSGMTGTFSMPHHHHPQGSNATGAPMQYLSGTMDQQQGRSYPNAYGGMDPTGNAGNTPPTTSSFFSWRCCMGCLRLETYQVFFDMDTTDILSRIKAVIWDFHRPDYFRLAVIGGATDDNDDVHSMPSMTTTGGIGETTTTTSSTLLRKGPDFYGPVWISMTFIFCLAATSNLAAYYDHFRRMKRHAATGNDKHVNPSTNTTSTYHTITDEEFEYDLTHLARAVTIVLVFTFVLPTAFWTAATCLGITRTAAAATGTPSSPGGSVSCPVWICCYGYSLVPYILASLLLWLPWSFFQWILLGLATVVSGLFVIRNLANPLLQMDAHENHAKSGPVLLAMIAAHFIFCIVLKESFYAD